MPGYLIGQWKNPKRKKQHLLERSEKSTGGEGSIFSGGRDGLCPSFSRSQLPLWPWPCLCPPWLPDSDACPAGCGGVLVWRGGVEVCCCSQLTQSGGKLGFMLR